MVKRKVWLGISFIGANINAVGTADKFVILADRVANYHTDGKGNASKGGRSKNMSGRDVFLYSDTNVF